MRVIWFVVLTVLAFVLGATGGGLWNVTKSGLAGLRVACSVTSTAERSGVLTRVQITDTIDRLSKRVAGSGHREAEVLFQELRNGCPSLARR